MNKIENATSPSECLSYAQSNGLSFFGPYCDGDGHCVETGCYCNDEECDWQSTGSGSVDCTGQCGGSALVDECGVCNGDGIADGACDCAGNVLDECGVCNGGGIADGACDCAGNVDLGCGCGEAAAADFYDCDGNCLSDSDADGVCDQLEIAGCTDANATKNYDPTATDQSLNEFNTSTCTYDSCESIPTDMGCLWSDGTSAMWWEGWWNCPANGGEVCGLAEVVFELTVPDGVAGTPYVQGSYNGWCGDCYNAMSDEDGDGTWTHTQYFGAGEVHEYKYSMDAWSNPEDVPDECSVPGTDNRGFTAGEANTSQTLSSCFGSCEDVCPDAQHIQ